MPFLAAVVVGDRSMDDDDDDDTAACCRLLIDAFERCIVAVISRHLLLVPCLLRPFHFKITSGYVGITSGVASLVPLFPFRANED
jgi:hypothetical protein